MSIIVKIIDKNKQYRVLSLLFRPFSAGGNGWFLFFQTKRIRDSRVKGKRQEGRDVRRWLSHQGSVEMKELLQHPLGETVPPSPVVFRLFTCRSLHYVGVTVLQYYVQNMCDSVRKTIQTAHQLNLLIQRLHIINLFILFPIHSLSNFTLCYSFVCQNIWLQWKLCATVFSTGTVFVIFCTYLFIFLLSSQIEMDWDRQLLQNIFFFWNLKLFCSFFSF